MGAAAAAAETRPKVTLIWQQPLIPYGAPLSIYRLISYAWPSAVGGTRVDGPISRLFIPAMMCVCVRRCSGGRSLVGCLYSSLLDQQQARTHVDNYKSFWSDCSANYRAESLRILAKHPDAYTIRPRRQKMSTESFLSFGSSK